MTMKVEINQRPDNIVPIGSIDEGTIVKSKNTGNFYLIIQPATTYAIRCLGVRTALKEDYMKIYELPPTQPVYVCDSQLTIYVN